MNYSTYRFTLDIHQTRSQVSIPVLYQDTWVQLFINLTDGGKPYKIEEGCKAVLYGKKADGKALVNDCEIIDNNTRIKYTFNDQTASCIGSVDCEIRLYSKDGLQLTTPSFVVLVEDRVIRDEDIVESDDEKSAIDRVLASEEERAEAETARAEAETVRAEAEAVRQFAETARADAEAARAEAESKRQEAEAARENRLTNTETEVDKKANTEDVGAFRGDGGESLVQNDVNEAQDTWAAALNKDTKAYGGGSFASGGGSVAGVSYEKFLELFGLADSESSKALYEAARARSSNNMNVSTPQDAGYRYWYAHAEGDTSKAYNRSSHAEGNHTEAYGHAAHSEGENTKAVGDVSHAEGASATALKRAAHAEGNGTRAEGEASHAEGDQTYATAIAAHAEGIKSGAAASGSHAEGKSYATGQYSHSEGESTSASGYASHAEGYNTNAAQNSAHSEGNSTHATAIASHAEGYGTKASSNYQHVQGKFNVEDDKGKYAHIVGWGTNAKPENIHTIDTYGNAEFKGSVKAAGKTLASVEDANAAAESAVAKLVGNSKETLNTLEELGKALGDDPNFATTMAAELGKHQADITRLDSAIGEKVDADKVDALVTDKVGEVTDTMVEEKVRATMDEDLAKKVDSIDIKNVYDQIVKGAALSKYSMQAAGDHRGRGFAQTYWHTSDMVSVEKGGSLTDSCTYLLDIPLGNGGIWREMVYWTPGKEINLSSPIYIMAGQWCVDLVTIRGDGRILSGSYHFLESTAAFAGDFVAFSYQPLLEKHE